MPSKRPRLVYDTSAINHLTNDGDHAALIAGLSIGYTSIVTGTIVAELAATEDPERREILFDTCERLLKSGNCIKPFYWIAEDHIKAFTNEPKAYDWKRVRSRMLELEREVVERTNITDELARVERASAKRVADEFEQIFFGMRPGFDEHFANGLPRPETFEEFLGALQKPGGVFWMGYGQMLFERHAGTKPDEETIRAFMTQCPPYYLLLVAVLMAHYERAIVPKPKGKWRAGRVDLLSATYLPYGDVFVTADEDQEPLLNQIAKLGTVATRVISYRTLRNELVGLH